MLLALAACGDKAPAPSGSGTAAPGTSQQEQEQTPSVSDNSDDGQPSGELDGTGVEWPENEWTAIIPKATDTVMKIDENMSTGMGNAYVIYMDWTDEDALAYGRKIAETGVTAAAPEIIDGVFQMFYTDPDTGRMVQITELGEAEDDYVIVLYK